MPSQWPIHAAKEAADQIRDEPHHQGSELVLLAAVTVAISGSLHVPVASHLLKACANAANITRAEYWHQRLLDEGVPLNERHYGKLIEAAK